MKVLFLDIDGVLNHRAHLSGHISPMAKQVIEDARKRLPTEFFAKKYDETGEQLKYITNHLAHISPEAVYRLNAVIEETGAKVVVSSTWRLFYGWDGISVLLKLFGFVGEVIDETPTLGTSRCYEIEKWLDCTPKGARTGRYAIIDDDDDAGLSKRTSPYFVQTSFEHGLTDVERDKLIELLGKKPRARKRAP